MANSTIPKTTGPATNVIVISVPWTSDGSGNYTEFLNLPAGFIIRCEAMPGSPTPTTGYSITLPGVVSSYDILQGIFASTSSAATVNKCPGLTISDGTNVAAVPFFTSGSHTFTVASAGANKQGTFNITIRM